MSNSGNRSEVVLMTCPARWWCLPLVFLALLGGPPRPVAGQSAAGRGPIGLLAAGRGFVSIESLRDAHGNPVRAEVFTREQAAINSAALNLAFARMENRGTQADPLYIPGKRFAVGPKIRLNYGYGGGALYGTGSIGDGGTYLTSTNSAAHSALVKISHFDEPVLEIPTVGARIDGLTIYGWHQGTTAALPGKPITGATNATPIVISSAAHGLPTGATVRISGVVGNVAANGKWTITRLDENRFLLDDSAGNGEYADLPTQGVWVSPGRTYAATGIRLVRADAGSPNFNTWLGPLSLVGCETGIAIDFDAGEEANTDNIYCPKLNFGVFGDCFTITNRDLTSLTIGQLRTGVHLFGWEKTASSFPLENIFNFRKGGGLNAQFVNTDMACTVLRTAEVGTGNQSYEIGTLRFDNDSPRNRVLVMESPRPIRVRVGMQYRDQGAAMTHAWVEWKHRGIIEGEGGFEHPDIEIDCREWRRDQAAGFPRRPLPGWPMPLFFQTRAYPSTKLWFTAANTSNWRVGPQPGDADPRRTLRHVATVADLSGAGNHLREASPGAGPKLWPQNFNHRDTLRFHSQPLINDSPAGFQRVEDLEIMFPIMLLIDSSGGSVIACDGGGGGSGWGVRVTPRQEIEWYQATGGRVETVTSHALQKETPYLAHIRRRGSTGKVSLLVDNAGSQSAGDLNGALNQPASGLLSPGPLAAVEAISIGGAGPGTPGARPLEGLVPDLFIDTALLKGEQLAERKRYLRAAYGVWEGVQLDEPEQ